jgi:hypothetical protein
LRCDVQCIGEILEKIPPGRGWMSSPSVIRWFKSGKDVKQKWVGGAYCAQGEDDAEGYGVIQVDPGIIAMAHRLPWIKPCRDDEPAGIGQVEPRMGVLLHVVAEAALLQDDRILVKEEQETLIHLLETSVPGVASVPDMVGAAGT